ncbi:hypothetical protein V247_02642, partial [Staphylococcus aureus F63712]
MNKQWWKEAVAYQSFQVNPQYH